jgi:hypothetical protein
MGQIVLRGWNDRNVIDIVSPGETESSEIARWCRNELAGMWAVKYYSQYTNKGMAVHGRVAYSFWDETDMVLFKLRWL